MENEKKAAHSVSPSSNICKIHRRYLYIYFPSECGWSLGGGVVHRDYDVISRLLKKTKSLLLMEDAHRALRYIAVRKGQFDYL